MHNKKLSLRTVAHACGLLLAGGAMVALAPAQAQNARSGMAQAAQKALASNPDVSARFNAFQATRNEAQAARGAYLPRLDLSATGGRVEDRFRDRTPEKGSLDHAGATLTLSQLLWDGLATRDEARRLDHAGTARYFELLDTTEQTALEAVRAYVDVQRYRRLVKLAEDNLVEHRRAFDQIQSRVKAGVGRGVDMEQAAARVALAESNLITEAANLHDVSARYLRVVGEPAPQQDETLPGLDGGLPGSLALASEQAAAKSPAVSAAIENLRAARAQAAAVDGAYHPRVEARLRHGMGKNLDVVPDQKRETAAELALNWNLFNGGRDRARSRQFADLVSQATDLRDKACRDARQTASIAYHDIDKLRSQVDSLERNTSAITKARDAYRQQFDIGQRSLLDLLNADNETYTARRALTNAQHDHLVAQARTHAAMQSLTAVLGISRVEPQDAPDLREWSAGDDAARCPADADPALLPRFEDAARRVAPAPVSVAPVATPLAMATAGSSTPAAAVAFDRAALEQRVRDWAAAWSAKDVERYAAFYDDGFAGSNASPQQWLAGRRQALGKAGSIRVGVESIQVTELGPDSVQTRFTQDYQSGNFNDRISKTLVWKRVGSQWLIVRESNR